MRRLIVIFSLSVSLILLLNGCGSQKQQPGKGVGNSGQVEKGQAATSNDAWEQLKKAAKEEGSVIVPTALSGNALKVIRQVWDKQNFGVNLEMVPMKGAELRTKISAERKSGLYTMDVAVTGMNTLVTVLKPMGALDPLDDSVLILPDVKNPATWYENKIPYSSKDKTIFVPCLSPRAPIFYNTSIVKADAIKSYQDLLKPEYKGKIVINEPRLSGSGKNWFTAMMMSGTLDRGYFEKLKNQLVPITKDEALQAQGLAQGKYVIGVALNPVEVIKVTDAGAPVAMVVPKEGTYLTSGANQVTLINKAPHPNAARLFINWYLTKEMQTALQAPTGVQSLRLDVPPTGLPKDYIRQPGVKYFNAATEEKEFKAEEFNKMAEEIFGSLK